jgi:PhnB protein
MHVTPYLDFDGRCEEAIEFYKKAIAAKVETMMRFKESPDPSACAPGTAEKIMHASIKIGDTILMATDGHCKNNAPFQGISLALSLPSDAEAERTFTALGQGGQVRMPLTKTFFSSRFGMLADKFGVPWMIIVMA